jgi:flavin-binding protein dodecin
VASRVPALSSGEANDQEEAPMSVAKIVELTANGPSIEDAINEGIAKAGESIRNIQHVYVDAIEAHVDGGKVSSFHVHLKLTFVVE